VTTATHGHRDLEASRSASCHQLSHDTASTEQKAK